MDLQANPPVMYKNFDEVIAVGENDTIGISEKDIVEEDKQSNPKQSNPKQKSKKDNVEENVDDK
jgi:hypothetical protein